MNLGTFGPEHPTRPAPTQQAAGPRAATRAAIEAMPHSLLRLTIAGSDSGGRFVKTTPSTLLLTRYVKIWIIMYGYISINRIAYRTTGAA